METNSRQNDFGKRIRYPDQLREDYQRAMGETTFVKSFEQGDMELMAKKQALSMLAKLQGLNDDEMKTIFRQKSVVLGRDLNMKDEVEVLGRSNRR